MKTLLSWSWFALAACTVVAGSFIGWRYVHSLPAYQVVATDEGAIVMTRKGEPAYFVYKGASDGMPFAIPIFWASDELVKNYWNNKRAEQGAPTPDQAN